VLRLAYIVAAVVDIPLADATNTSGVVPFTVRYTCGVDVNGVENIMLALPVVLAADTVTDTFPLNICVVAPLLAVLSVITSYQSPHEAPVF